MNRAEKQTGLPLAWFLLLASPSLGGVPEREGMVLALLVSRVQPPAPLRRQHMQERGLMIWPYRRTRL
jgi:hypothetical protein